MRIVVIGGTGFIGTCLSNKMADLGWQVVVLSRSAKGCQKHFGHQNISCSFWDGRSADSLLPYIEGVAVVVNLAGSGIADKKWTIERKEEIIRSRVVPTRALAQAIESAYVKPVVVVQGSAVGFYGYDYLKTNPVDEYGEKGTGFLADVCRMWEDAILPVEHIISRLIIVRTGVVLGRQGFLKKLRIPFKLGLGGQVGTGLQPFPWIHIDDEVGAIVHLITNPCAVGVYNLVAPEYACFSDFVKLYSRVLKRPAVVSTPTFLLRLAYGKELVNEVLLGGMEIKSNRLVNEGYAFRIGSLYNALFEIEKKGGSI